jgi:hypothetical protein
VNKKGNNIILNKIFTVRGLISFAHLRMDSLKNRFSWRRNVELINDVSQIRMELLCLNS